MVIVIVALMLHSGGESHHRQVMGIHNVIDITGKTHREFSHGDKQALPPPAAVPLTFMVGPPEGWRITAADIQSPLTQTLDKTHCGSGLTFTEAVWG